MWSESSQLTISRTLANYKEKSYENKRKRCSDLLIGHIGDYNRLRLLDNAQKFFDRWRLDAFDLSCIGQIEGDFFRLNSEPLCNSVALL